MRLHNHKSARVNKDFKDAVATLEYLRSIFKYPNGRTRYSHEGEHVVCTIGILNEYIKIYEEENK